MELNALSAMPAGHASVHNSFIDERNIRSERKSESRPAIFSGALASATLTVAMMAVFFAGWRLGDLPFVPFDIFDWMAQARGSCEQKDSQWDPTRGLLRIGE